MVVIALKVWTAAGNLVHSRCHEKVSTEYGKNDKGVLLPDYDLRRRRVGQYAFTKEGT